MAGGHSAAGITNSIGETAAARGVFFTRSP